MNVIQPTIVALVVGAGIFHGLGSAAVRSAPLDAQAQGSPPLARTVAAAQDTGRPPRLRIADDGRRIVQEDGTPFFWLGDTAWELFHRLNREQATRYLEDRARKGFNVIQAVVLAELDGLHEPNAEGHTPLLNDDPTTPNEAYFEHVDAIVDIAADLGMYVGMLPTWGDKFNRRWGIGPEVFTPENARTYGEFLGRRYVDDPIIWILGGDRIPESDQHLAIIRAMADGIRAVTEGRQLITYHPMGGRKSWEWFHDDDWLDVNIFQSGHGHRDLANDRLTDDGYGLRPVKPVIDGEPRYEDHPIDWNPEEGWFEAFDVRQAAYWSVLAGAAGHTYGNHNIWQMWEPGREPVSAARTPWREALDHVGAAQMGHMKRLFLSRPFLDLVPDPFAAVSAAEEVEEDDGPDHVRVARDVHGRYLIAYTPYGLPIEIDLSTLSGVEVRAWWFDPRTGVATAIGSLRRAERHAFDPPGDVERGNDWVLVIDDAAQGYAAPGTTNRSGDVGAGQDEVLELTGGRWFDGETFIERTVYVSDSLFVSDPGERPLRKVDLGGRYIVPPFADAHSHNLSGEPRWREIHETYLSEGTFYVLVMHNATSGAAPVRDRLREPGTVDVAYGGAAVTSTLGYPFLRYEPRAMGLNDASTWPDNAAAIRRSRLMEGDGYVFVDSTADVESKLDEVLAQCASHVKIILFDGERFAEQSADTQRIGDRGLDPALVPDIVARAHAADVRVIAHIETPYDFRLAVDAGVDVIAHVPGYNLARDADPAEFRLTAETARRAAERGIVVTPTVFAHRVVTDAEWARRRYEVLHHNLTLLKEHGVTIAPGTDVYGVTARPEIEELARFDIWTHAELLAMWSTAGPRVVFPDRRIGALEPGYEASFLALDCNPTANLACTHRIALRFMDGRFLEPRGSD